MKCWRCGADNGAAEVYCNRCATSLAREEELTWSDITSQKFLSSLLMSVGALFLIALALSAIMILITAAVVAAYDAATDTDFWQE